MHNSKKPGNNLEATLLMQGNQKGRNCKGGPILWLASKVTL